MSHSNQRPRRRKLLVPEVVQTSAMDCGPACLKSLLEGHGVSVSYGRLREACHTDVDGSSIDTIEEVAVQLGLDATQMMVPADHLLLPEAALLPAIVVVRQPSGTTHFVVAWGLVAGVVQVMDPATGRRWSMRRQFLDEVHTHEMAVSVEAWSEWSGTEAFLACLRRRLSDLGVDGEDVSRWIEDCSSRGGWRPMAALDAAARLTDSIVRGGGLRAGREARHAVQAFFDRAMDEASDPTAAIPAEYWTVRPRDPRAPRDGTLLLRGAVLVSIEGRRAEVESDAGVMSDEGSDGARMDRTDPVPAADRSAGTGSAPERPRVLPPDLAHALAEKPTRPGLELLALLLEDGLLAPIALVSMLALGAAGVLIEALLFRALFGIGRDLAIPEQRLLAIAALAFFLALLLLLELPVAKRTLAMGRHLESRMRLELLKRIPWLDDRYFRSRLVSDMAERGHKLHEVRVLPELGAEVLRSVFGIILTTIGILWLDPRAAPFALAAAAVSIVLPLAAQPLLTDCDLRLRNHSGALLRFHLDALLGIIPLRAHAAGRALRREHESLVAEWTRAGLRCQRRAVAVEALQSVAGFALAALLIFDHASREASGASALLLAYWSLSLPVLGQQVGLCARQYPAQRSLTLRFLELLGTPVETQRDELPPPPSTGGEEPRADAQADVRACSPESAGGVAVRWENVSVKASGHTVLDAIDLEIAAGSHVAIVGPSGAGKSSLVGLLLGWHQPLEGRVLIDDAILDRRSRDRLLRETAWVDPSVQLWNRSLLENLCYGNEDATARTFGPTMERAGLSGVLDRLPEGLQSVLGEGGALVSGGEGQRVRLARATLRARTRLAILDEAFRGLTREQRTDLLAFTRDLWRESTLLCITHDIGETMSFDRVLVVESGRIVEDGAPEILARGRSRYAAMIEAEESVRAGLWSGDEWRRMRLEDGRLLARRPEEAP